MANEPHAAEEDALPTERSRRRFPRFPTIITPVAVAALALMWATSWLERDVRNFVTVPVVAGTVLLLGCWFLLFSDASWRLRQVVVYGGIAVLAVLVAVFRLDGYTGDMKPKIVFRWTPKPYELLTDPLEQQSTDVRSASDGATAMVLTETTPYDYPQFLGPRRIPIVSNVKLARDWTSTPPERLWRKPIGAGRSAFSVVGQYAVTQEQRGDQEMVVCYELQTGEVVWSHADPGRFTSIMGGDGPRATPTVHEGKVYTQGAWGLLNCLDGGTGKVLWSHDILEENGADNTQWGRSGSPLVVDHLVVVSAGGPEDRSLVAYDKDTGDLVWASGGDMSSYSSPALATLGVVPQVLIVNQDWLVGHRLSDGHILWRYPWPGSSSSNASNSQPVPIDEQRVFVSKGYGIGCTLLKVQREGDDQFSVTDAWESPRLLRTKLTNVVLRNGYVYGLSQGVLECVSLSNGDRRWKRGRYGHGQIILVDDLILISAETGEVALVEASPERYRELGRFQAIEGKTWNNPALAGPYLLVRNDREAACYVLPLAE